MKNSKTLRTLDMIYIALFGVLIGICSLITIPGAVPITLQTFGVFMTISTLGGKKGTASVLFYIFMGIIGLPLFSGFQGGIGVLLGPTGGYIIGFIFSALLMWLFEKLFGNNTFICALSMIIALITCYISGTLWYVFIYSGNDSHIGIGAAVSVCVLPFVIPDIIKISLVLIFKKRLRIIISSAYNYANL